MCKNVYGNDSSFVPKDSEISLKQHEVIIGKMFWYEVFKLFFFNFLCTCLYILLNEKENKL